MKFNFHNWYEIYSAGVTRQQFYHVVRNKIKPKSKRRACPGLNFDITSFLGKFRPGFPRHRANRFIGFLVKYIYYITALASAAGSRKKTKKKSKKIQTKKSKNCARVVIQDCNEYAKIAIFGYLKTQLNIDEKWRKLVRNMLSYICWSTRNFVAKSQTGLPGQRPKKT